MRDLGDMKSMERDVRSHDAGLRVGRAYGRTRSWLKKERSAMSAWREKRRSGHADEGIARKDHYYPRDFRGPFGPYGW